ncbi:hypothetical protein AKO1_009872 [Acrasis kona]|uniref:Palmitoyltransferase n=1 Tax=Acrasis kona TaxID=1008807 RepID=A0AAW2ZNC9_9EUKA
MVDADDICDWICKKCCSHCCFDETKYSERENNKSTERLMRGLVFVGYIYVLVMAVFMDSILWDNFIVSIPFFALYCFSLYLLELLRFKDPGIINKQPSNSEAITPQPCQEAITPLKQRTNTQEHSIEIEIPHHTPAKTRAVGPPRSKYCKVCEAQISKFDHHCVWIGNCVGEKNQLHFLSFLIIESIFLSFCAFLCGNSLYRVASSITNVSEPNGRILFTMAVLLPSIITALVLALFPFLMFCNHLYMICINQTSYESYKIESAYRRKEEVPTYNHGCRANIVAFIQQITLEDNKFMTWNRVKNPKPSND